VSFLNFRYLLLGFPSALGRYQKQKRAKKWAQVLPKTPKIPNTKGHVVREKNINNVVENNSQTNIKVLRN